MEDIEILQGIGTPPDILNKYVDLRERSRKILTKEFLSILILLPIGLIFLISLEMGLMKYFFIAMIFLFLIPTFLVIAFYFYYFLILSTKVEKRYYEMIKNNWLISQYSEIMRVHIEKKFTYILSGEAALTLILYAYFTGAIIVAFLSLLFLVIIPAMRMESKKAREIGYTIERLFPGDVDEIAEKIEKALGGKKAMVIKYKNNRRYKIDFNSQSNLKIYVSRRPERKEFTTVEIMGVKNENLSEVVKLISQINKILT